MPGKPRARPQKVLRSEVFPVCPFTDPLSSERDVRTESRGLAYLSDGNTVIDASLDSRLHDDNPVLSSRSLSIGLIDKNAVATSYDDDPGSPITTSETTLLNNHDNLQVLEQECKEDLLLQPAATRLTQMCPDMSTARDVQVVFNQPGTRPSIDSAEQDQCTISTLSPDANPDSIEGATTHSEVDGSPNLVPQSTTRYQGWLSYSRDSASNLSTLHDHEAPHVVSEDAFISTNRTAASRASIPARQDTQFPRVKPSVCIGQVTSIVPQETSVRGIPDPCETIPLWAGRTDSRRPLTSTISSTPGLSSLLNPSTSSAGQLIEDTTTHVSRTSHGLANYAPLTALRTMFSRNTQRGDTELYQRFGDESPTDGRTYQNIIAQGSSNNVFGDQITHIHHKQSTAVTTAVATSSASGGFFGGIFAAKALSQDHTSNPPATTIPLPAPKAAPLSSLDSSVLTSAGNFLTRMVHGPPPPPDPGPVKIGDLTKDCLQALFGGKGRLEAAPISVAKPQGQSGTVTQELLTRMVAQTVLTAAIPRVTINL